MLCTVPLRSVSVAWTNRISPDPARTSGPSSFWGVNYENEEKMNDRKKRWLRLKAREKKSELELMWSDAV